MSIGGNLVAGTSQVGRGSGGKNVIFSNCPYDKSEYSDPHMMYIKFSKKNEWKGSVGCLSKLTFLRFGILSGLGYRIFGGFQLVSTHYSMLMTPYPPHKNIDVII
jgi:hypothetical protein